MSDATTVPAVRLGDIAVDAIDPEKVAAFWAALLGVEVDGRRGVATLVPAAQGVYAPYIGVR